MTDQNDARARAREIFAQTVEKFGGVCRDSIAADIRRDVDTEYYPNVVRAMLAYADERAATARGEADELRKALDRQTNAILAHCCPRCLEIIRVAVTPPARRKVMPIRVQLRRTKGWRMPPNTVKVSRPSPYGNYAGSTKADFDADIASMSNADRAFLMDRAAELRGKNLACWCALDVECHADTWLELATPPARDEGGE
ncbi:MAG TPA: DUF4326 domain-containing protein [Gammaproteobacteria bacterium]|nr:DUF4326 domain-containing protein [Gammaproteobacteria bacterium]